MALSGIYQKDDWRSNIEHVSIAAICLLGELRKTTHGKHFYECLKTIHTSLARLEERMKKIYDWIDCKNNTPEMTARVIEVLCEIYNLYGHQIFFTGAVEENEGITFGPTGYLIRMSNTSNRTITFQTRVPGEGMIHFKFHIIGAYYVLLDLQGEMCSYSTFEACSNALTANIQKMYPHTAFKQVKCSI